MNKKETIFPRLYDIWIDTELAIPITYTTKNERNIVLSIHCLKFGDFVFRIKAKNAFHVYSTISPVEHCKNTFFFNITLFLGILFLSKGKN